MLDANERIAGGVVSLYAMAWSVNDAVDAFRPLSRINPDAMSIWSAAFVAASPAASSNA